MAYTKTTWVTGDKVTSTKLNKIEQGIYDNDAACDELKTALINNTDNLLKLKTADTTNKGVVFSNNGANGMSIIGTATDSGGRNNKLTENLTLTAGTYYLYCEAPEQTPQFLLQDVNGNSIIKYIVYINTLYSFTLSETTTVYIGANVVNGTTYNIHNVYIKLGTVEEIGAYPRETAIDFIARDAVKPIKYLNDSCYYDLREIYPFEVGATNSGTISNSIRYRIVSAKKYTAQEDLYVYMPTGYKFEVIIYTGNTYTDSGWLHGDYVIPKGTTFAISCAKDPEVTTDKLVIVQDSPIYQNLTFKANEQTKSNGIISVEPLAGVPTWTQGACRMKNLILGFDASADDGSTAAFIRVYDIEQNLTLVKTLYHRLGHCATADYRESTDTILVSVGTYTAGSPEKFYLIKNATDKVENSESDWTTSDEGTISFDVNTLNGVSCGACFGEDDNIVYVVKVESASASDTYVGKYFYKCLLGKGDNNLLTKYSSGNFGTFISDCDDNEYNGTMHVLATYEFSASGEVQGMKYRNGYLYMSSDTSKFDAKRTPYFVKFDLQNMEKEYYKIPFYNNATGEEAIAEAEGFVFDGAYGYVSVIGSSIYKVLKFDSIF